MSIGVEFQEKTALVDDQIFLFQLWDIGGGGERFLSLISAYLRHCSAAIVMYDITGDSLFHIDKRSFERADKWVAQVRRVRGDNALVVLVGNKADLHEKRQVSFEEGHEKATELEALFCEVSAKHATNVH